MTSENLTTGFTELGLREELLRAIAESGYETPTAIQAEAIPEILNGRDVVGVAQTGTGKTASFVLPMLQALAAGRARARMPRSLILSPTRELATQTSANFETYGKHLNLSMALLIGGVAMGDQEKTLERGVDVLIATPGRLLDWFDRGKILLGGVSILVIDEADRMLDMGFIPDVERIITLLTGRRQTLLFSATMPKEVRRLADRFLIDPAQIEVAPPERQDGLIDDVLIDVKDGDKRKALDRLLREQAVKKALIFSNRKRDVGSVTRFLQKSGKNARDIHGDLEQSVRQATLNAFKAGDVDFLVATDVAARGLDINDMPVVINIDVPMNAEDYIHRIGRTGRAGRKGRAFTFATDYDTKYVSAIERLLGRSIERLNLAAVDKASSGQAAEPVTAANENRTGAAPRERRSANPRHTKPRSSAPQPDRQSAVASDSRTQRRPAKKETRTVVGMGDHVPAFLMNSAQ